MKYHTLFFSKIQKDVENLLPAAFVIGALREKCGIFGNMGQLGLVTGQWRD